MPNISSLRAQLRDDLLKLVSNCTFLDGVFSVERFNRVSARTRTEDHIELRQVYPGKTAEELAHAVARVQHLNEIALQYVCAAVDKSPDQASLLAKVFDDNPGFSRQTYDLALNDAFVAMR